MVPDPAVTTPDVYIPPTATDPALQPRFPTGTIDLEELLRWKQDEYRQHLKNSAMKRVKLPVLQRNAKIVAANLSEQP